MPEPGKPFRVVTGTLGDVFIENPSLSNNATKYQLIMETFDNNEYLAITDMICHINTITYTAGPAPVNRES